MCRQVWLVLCTKLISKNNCTAVDNAVYFILNSGPGIEYACRLVALTKYTIFTFIFIAHLHCRYIPVHKVPKA